MAYNIAKLRSYKLVIKEPVLFCLVEKREADDFRAAVDDGLFTVMMYEVRLHHFNWFGMNSLVRPYMLRRSCSR